MDRKKLDTVIEKECYKLNTRIKEHTLSFIILGTRRKGIKVDPIVLAQLSEIVSAGFEDGFQSQIDFFTKNVGKALEEFEEDVTPIMLNGPKKTK